MRLGLALGSALLLAACGVGSTPTAGDPAAPSTPPAATGVVPWADLPPAHERIPTHRVPASPDPGPAEAAPPCTAGQLGLKDEGVGAAMGTAYERLTVRLVRGEPCSVVGWPSIVYLDGADDSGIAVDRDGGGYDVGGLAYRHPVLIDGSSTASVELSWSDGICDYDRRPLTTSVALALPAGGSVSAPLATHDEPSCYLDAEHGGHGDLEHVTVGHFYPTHYRAPVVTSDWDAVRVVNRHPLRLAGRAGSTLDFTVTLMARGHDVPLQSCPDYQVLFAGEEPTVETHELNCAAVPYRRDGVPYLPAGTPVVFAMRATAPSHAAPKALWSIPVADDVGGTGWGGTFQLLDAARPGG